MEKRKAKRKGWGKQKRELCTCTALHLRHSLSMECSFDSLIAALDVQPSIERSVL
jgi:hypothetical protein